MRLLASVCPDMARLMLETVEGFIAERTFVWSRQVGSLVFLTLHGDTDGRHRHRRTSHRVWRLRPGSRRAAVGGRRCDSGRIAVAQSVRRRVGEQ